MYQCLVPNIYLFFTLALVLRSVRWVSCPGRITLFTTAPDSIPNNSPFQFDIGPALVKGFNTLRFYLADKLYGQI